MHILRGFLCLLLSGLLTGRPAAHPMPNSLLLLDVKETGIAAGLQWPLDELQLALPDEDITGHSTTLLQRSSTRLREYLLQHLTITDTAGRDWQISIRGLSLDRTVREGGTPYDELRFQLWLEPPSGAALRRFTIHYDAIMHQLVTHRMLVSVRQDWDNGVAGESGTMEPGVLMMNPADNRVAPVEINLDRGSRWQGFRAMVAMGMDHIARGTDHLLFLLVMVLPAPLIAAGRRWAKTGGMRYSIVRLLKIVTAFTIGHSLTLLAGSLDWIRLPSQPVELLIAVSILVGAAHAIRPLFPGKELFIAGTFGLIHGLAFAASLSDLQLDAGRMALSILGFNVGIELLQLFVIVMIAPWLILLSRYPVYRFVRTGGAALASVAAFAWIAERITGKPNAVAAAAEQLVLRGQWLVLGLVLLVILMQFISTRKPAGSS